MPRRLKRRKARKVHKFWLVWTQDGHNPKYRHESYQAAQKEAERLAAINPRQHFYVVEAIGFAVKTDVRFEKLDEIPF